MPKLLRGKLLRSSPGAGDKTSILQRFGSLHRRFLNSLVWPEAAGLASVEVGTSMLEGCRWCLCLGGSHDGLMGYLPTCWLIFMVDVGKYTIHGSHDLSYFATKTKVKGKSVQNWFLSLYQLDFFPNLVELWLFSINCICSFLLSMVSRFFTGNKWCFNRNANGHHVVHPPRGENLQFMSQSLP